MNGSLIIILLVFLSGLIAYLGDRIGMRAGKKRISIFGLRPRYSSIIITILTGILIAALSLTILLFTYSNLRQALFNINQVLSRLENLNQELVEKDQELTRMQNEIETKASELERLQEQRNKLETKLSNTEQEFEEAKESLEQARTDIDSLEEERQHLQDRVSELNQQRESLEDEVDDLNNQIDELTTSYQEVRELAGQYWTGMMYYRGEDIVYQKGDIIYSDVIEGGQSQQETIDDLNQFLSEANEEARQKPIKIDEESGMALKLQTEDIMNAARVLYNMEQEEKAIVSLVAGVNVPRDDWLLANFLLNRNFIVFEKDEVIESRVIDADLSSNQIEDSLQELLNDVNQQAIEEGLLPDTRGLVGSLDFSRFYELVNYLEDSTGKIRVEVYAAEEIWRENRLGDNIEFNLEPVVEGNEE